jgi:hypothetical protein
MQHRFLLMFFDFEMEREPADGTFPAGAAKN